MRNPYLTTCTRCNKATSAKYAEQHDWLCKACHTSIREDNEAVYAYERAAEDAMERAYYGCDEVDMIG